MDNFARYKWLNANLLFLIALILGNSLLLTPEGSLPRAVGTMVLLLLPGVVWFEALALTPNPLMRWTMGLGLSYVLMIILGMLLHYLPGAISIWMVLVPLNIVTLGAIAKRFMTGEAMNDTSDWSSRASFVLLLVILLYGGFFRFVNLGYSEFQGDEVKALVPAAEAIEGREDVLFYQRKKGPGEILIPMMVWRLAGLIDEPTARTLFPVAGLMVMLTTYVLGKKLFGEQVGLVAAGLVGLNGFMVAFSRIIQYQEIVIWMSLLSLLSAWEWRRDGRGVWWILAGVFLGTGVLAHYDTILIAPALVYVFLTRSKFSWSSVKGLISGGVVSLLVVGLFFGPYLLNTRLDQAGRYLSRRIGFELLKNSLYDFFFFTIFYNSLYYVVVVGLLALGFLVWALANLNEVKRMVGGRYVLPAVAGVVVIGLSLWPDTLNFSGIDWTFLPFTLIFLGAFLSPVVNLEQRVAIVWVATAFLGYNFLIGDPRTHVYAVTLPWVLLASIAAVWLWRSLAGRFNNYLPLACSVLLTILFSGYLYLVYLRQNPEYETDWPESQLAFYQFPYAQLSRHDTFGFVHKVGWKTVGGLYVAGQIEGDYQTNGLFEISEWYTRHQLRGCYRQSTQFFAVEYRLIDLREMPSYRNVGEIDLPNEKGITIYQVEPVDNNYGSLDVDYLNHIFDRTARPSAFVRPVKTKYPAEINLAGVIQLVDYEITIPQAQPGGRVAVLLHWKSQKHIPLDLDVFVHLEDEGNPVSVWGQSNGSPACGEQPTSEWSVGTPVTDPHVFVINPDTPPGNYVIMAGMYLPNDNVRVPVFDEAGDPVAESIKLATITIQ